MLTTLIIAILASVLFFTLFLQTWVTDEDFNGLSKDPIKRFVDLFYFVVACFSTAGFGDIYAKSSRARMCVATYMLAVNVTAVTSFYQLFYKK